MTLAPLPASLTAAAVVVAMAASAVLSFLSPFLSSVPGFRASDGARRDNLLRLALGVLNLAGLLGYAWSQRMVLDQSQLPALLVTVIGAGVGGHFVYSAVKSGASASLSLGATLAPGLQTSAPIAVAPSPPAAVPAVPAVPPLPSDPTPTPVPVPAAAPNPGL